MMSFLFLVSALMLGAAVVRRLNLPLLRFEAPALTVVVGLVLWTWLSFLCSLLLPYTYNLALTLILATVATLVLWRRAPAWSWQTLPGGPAARTAWAVFTGATTLIIGTLMWTHDLVKTDTGLYSANATWADFGLHASLINHFLAGSRLPLDFPLAAGTHLTYPFMVDLLSSWLVYGGWSLHAAIFVPSLLLVAAFLQLMLSVGIRLFKSIGGAVIGLTLTLLSGSAAGLFVASKDFAASHLSLSQFLGQLPKDYTALSAPNAQVTNFVADIILPQRAFVMGAAVFAAVLSLFTALRDRPTRRLAIFTGALIGLLPLIHAHTFVMLMALTTGFWIEAYLKSRTIINQWLIVGLSALALTIPQLAWQTFANGSGTGGHLSLGWTINPGEPLLSFWANNYGLTLLLIIGLSILVLTLRPLRRYITWYMPFIVVFIAANIYSLQPFAYDNLKLITYVYLITYLAAGYGAVWLVRRYRATILPLALIAVLIAGSGALAITREFQHQDQFASIDDIALADWAKASTATSAVFLTTDRPNQPLATLAGRTIVVGYRGWLYNYNLPYQARLAAVQQAFSGQATTANPYHARYVAVGAYEAPEWTIDTPAMSAAYIPVYTNASWTVYELPR
jgi:hypothetical protein